MCFWRRELRAVATFLLGIALGCTAHSTPTGARTVRHAATIEAATLIGAGDIAGCDPKYQDEATAALIDSVPGVVFTTGDNAYPDGRVADFGCYASSWGRFKNRTRPVPGNHDYHTANGAEYFSAFGPLAGPAGRGYYSYDAATWHIIALNSEIDTTEQLIWLRADLAAHPYPCVLAYWHRPLFTSGAVHRGSKKVRPYFAALDRAGAEIVLNGHSHQYERFFAQTAAGVPSERGIVEFVVGTGGATLHRFGKTQPNSAVRDDSNHGVLELRLYPGWYYYEFIPTARQSPVDAGGGTCH